MTEDQRLAIIKYMRGIEGILLQDGTEVSGEAVKAAADPLDMAAEAIKAGIVDDATCRTDPKFVKDINREAMKIPAGSIPDVLAKVKDKMDAGQVRNPKAYLLICLKNAVNDNETGHKRTPLAAKTAPKRRKAIDNAAISKEIAKGHPDLAF